MINYTVGRFYVKKKVMQEQLMATLFKMGEHVETADEYISKAKMDQAINDESTFI